MLQKYIEIRCLFSGFLYFSLLCRGTLLTRLH
jgi:hypothetical protein